MELSEGIARFLTAKRAQGRKTATVEWYAIQLSLFQRWLNGRAVTPQAIEDYLRHRRAEGLQPTTVAAAHRTLRTFYNWLLRRGLVDSSPVRYVDPPAVPEKRPHFVTFDAFQQLTHSIPVSGAWLDARDRAIISVLFYAGLRVGELCRLRRKDIDREKRVLWLYGRKGNDDHFVPLHQEAEYKLLAYLRLRPGWGTDHLFLAADGDNAGVDGALTPIGVRAMLARRCAAAGMARIKPNAFRHGLAIHMLELGADLPLIQQVLGHKDIRTTQRYARWQMGTVVQRYDEIFKRK